MGITFKEESASEEGIAQKEEVIFQLFLFREGIVVHGQGHRVGHQELLREVKSCRQEGTQEQESELAGLE